MNDEKAVLRRRTRLRFLFVILRNGAQNIIHNRKKRLTFLLAALAIFAAVAYMSRPNRYLPMIVTIAVIGYAAIGIAALAAVVYLLGRVPHAWHIYDDFVRIGWVNSAGEAPVLITYERRATHLYLLRFWCRGLPREEWENAKEKIETALNLRIIDTMDGDDRREVIVLCTDASALPTWAVWRSDFVAEKDFELVLGKYAAGHATIDLASTPHLLIAGTTGSGKSTLLQSIVSQCLIKNAKVTIADWKGGADYRRFRGQVEIVSDNNSLLCILEDYCAELDNRKQLLADCGCANIHEYNDSGRTMRRWVLVLDETSMILDTTGRTKDEKEQIGKILSGLLTLTRLGRFAGLHVIVSTQRPDVSSIPGALKANLDGRICGRMPDVATSTVILDDGSAAKLPAVPGRFLIRDGSGHDKIFQAYVLTQN